MKYKLRESKILHLVSSFGFFLLGKVKNDKSGTRGSRWPNPHGNEYHDHHTAPAEKPLVLWEGSWAGIRRPGCGFWWPLYPLVSMLREIL